MPEAGRAIIRDQVAIGGAALPWADSAAFAELMLGWELRSWHEAHDRAGTVIDRKRVVEGNNVAVRVDFGGSRIIESKTHKLIGNTCVVPVTAADIHETAKHNSCTPPAA